MLYNLSKSKQLIDLNQNLTNFSSTFTITPEDNTVEYEAAVANQTELDSGNEIAYRKVRGPLSGSVENDNGVYQNYFLIVRSETGMKNVDVSISLTEIEKPVPTIPTREPQILPPIPTTDDKNWSNIRYMAMFLVILGGGFLLYYFYKTSNKNKPTSPVKQLPPIKSVFSSPKNLSPKPPVMSPPAKKLSPVPTVVPVNINPPVISPPKSSPMISPAKSPEFEAKIPFTFKHKLF